LRWCRCSPTSSSPARRSARRWNSGTLPLTITTAVLAQEYSLESSSEGGPALSWYDLSAAEALAFSDDLIYTDALDLGFAMPVFGTLYDRIYLSSNGWFSFVPDSDPEPAAYCFPSTELPDVGFAPFWTDLDPSKGGAIRAAQVDSETYVISFEQVPLFQQPSILSPAPVYSFQAVLRQSGLIQYLYGPLGDMPQRYSVGYAARVSGGYSLFCSTSAAPAKAGPLEGQAWSLEHQRSPSHWLGSSPSPLVIAPGQSSSLTATLWGNVGWLAQRQAPYLGRLVLSSNDPLQPSLQLLARLRIGPPPYQQFLPRYVR
jgi:hypothetical protein